MSTPFYYRCPQCGQRDAFHEVQEQRNSSLGLGLGILVFGGILPTAIFAASRSYARVQCGGCGLIFPQPRVANTRTAVVLYVVALLILVLVAVMGGVVYWESLGGQPVGLEGGPLEVELFIRGRAELVVTYALPALGVVVVGLWIAAAISNYRRRKEVWGQFSYVPLPPR